jgi:UDP-N-acetylmuramoyl-L-alanyl-D-glutamate--2,6-diaminopimelate ligase
MKRFDEISASMGWAGDTVAKDAIVAGITSDSRAVKAGFVFVAIKGVAADGHLFIPKAIENGALAVVCETLPERVNGTVPCIQVSDSRQALAQLACIFYDHPSRRLKLTGITGTNGKTTTATLLYQLFTQMGYPCGLLSTVVNIIDGKEIKATHTTPDPVELNRLLREMVDAGCSHAFMEVSSHALHQHRVTGIHFSLAVFSNITHDHLDYHGTFRNYIDAKKMLFDMLPPESFALLNRDDAHAEVMAQNCRATVRTYALKSHAYYKVRILETGFEGTLLQIGQQEVWVQLLGKFNAYNLICAFGCADILGENPEEILPAMSMLKPVAGRFEYLRSPAGLTGVIDYAHTPDALEKILDAIREIRQEGQQIAVVVGCGGDRDRQKRPEMARIAAEKADKAIFTSDNPRTENPTTILQEMNAGVPAGFRRKVLTIENRREAIRAAVMMSGVEDIVLVAGKGHENYQIIGVTSHYFSDREELEKLFNPTT